jgi:diacylglycerol kinase (ATP)
MHGRQIWPEVFALRSKSRVGAAVRNAVRRGIKLVVVAGGDGTIDSVAGALVGSSATLGIIPTGTRNNVAFSLGIPSNIADAVALLREGRRLKIDVGHAHSGRTSRWFLEAATLGLISTLYSSADEIQHGNLAHIGELLTKFASATASRLRMILDGRTQLDTTAHVLLISNMPFLGPHFQIASDVSFNDGRLDVFAFSDLTKLDLVSYAMQSIGGTVEDARIKHYRVKHLTIDSAPPMAVLADGVLLGHGRVTALVRPRALTVMAGAAIGGKSVPSPAINRDGAPHG